MKEVTKNLQLDIDYETHHWLWTTYKNKKSQGKTDVLFSEFCVEILKKYVEDNKIF